MLGWALGFHNADDPHDVLSPDRGNRRPTPSLSTLVHAVRRRERPRRVLHHVGTLAGGAGVRRRAGLQEAAPAPRRAG